MTLMQSRIPSTLYTIVDTLLRAEVPGSAGLLQPVLSSSVAVWTRVVQVLLRVYTQMLCHIPYGSLILACQPTKTRKGLYSHRLEKMSGLAWTLVHGALWPWGGGRRRSLTTRVCLWTPRRLPRRQPVRETLVRLSQACCSLTTPGSVLSSRMI